MGVPGLWDVLRPAGKQRSLAQLAVYDGFERNPGGRRGLRVGIDASIWFFHATYGREGENPELRTLFFRCARLMSRPFLPLFVFDGPHRPELKRKKKISGKDHWMVSGMQEIIEAFGFEWWFAPGEAEAELAYLNKIGVIDAIITDDVDTFLFGATTIIRNPGNRLSGNTTHSIKNSAGRDDGDHTYVYTSTDIAEHPDVSLSQDGLILIALLRGGDYDPEGIDGCGTGVAHALARCGFGETLLSAARNLPRLELPAFLDGWRNEVRAELRSNARGFLNSRKLRLAKSFPDSFPNVEVLELYMHPVTSELKKVRPEFLWNREPDLMKLAALCERKFEWGVREIIIKRFRTVMWAFVVLRIMRRAVLDADAPGPSTPRKKKASNDKGAPPGTPSKMIARHFSSLSVAEEDDTHRLIVGIRGKREHASTDGMPEYRLEIAPAQLVRLTSAGVQGIRLPPSQYRPDSDDEEDFDLDDDEEEQKTSKRIKKPPPDPDSYLRVWMPACIVERVEPAMVAVYEGKVSSKTREKEEKAARKAARAAAGASPKVKSKSRAQASRTKRAVPKRTEHEEEEEEELSAGEDYSHVFNLPSKNKSKSEGKAKAGGASGTKKSTRTRPVHSVHKEEEEEEEDLCLPRPSNKSKDRAVPLAEATNGNSRRQLKESASESTTVANVDTRKAQLPTTLKSSTNLAKQKTFLDLLDERSRNTSAHVPSAISGSSSPKANSQILAPRPFPLSKAEDDRLFGDRDEPHIPRRISASMQRDVAAKTAVRQYSTVKSESKDSIHTSPKKSPRKSKTHRSPLSKSIVFDTVETITDSDVDLDDRPASPSPTRPRASRSTNTDSVSVSAAPSARVSSSLSTTSAISGPAKTSVSQRKTKTVEIIEITSGSESEQGNQSGSRSGLTRQGSKTTVPTLAKRVNPGKSSQRLDAMFRVVKPNISGSQKATQVKAGSNRTKSRQMPTYDLDDVIEIP